MKNGAILIVCQAWHGEQLGGSFKLAGEFAQYLAARGREVHFICASDTGEQTSPETDAGVHIWRYANPKGASPSLINLLYHFHQTSRLTHRILKETSLSCLNGHSPLQFLAAARIVAKRSVRTVYSVHSPFVAELKSAWGIFRTPAVAADQERKRTESRINLKLPQRLALRAAEGIEKRVYARADALQTFSEYTLTLLRQQFSQDRLTRASVCPAWIDPGDFSCSENRTQLRKSLGKQWDPEKITFLSLRRLERRMGLDLLVKACRSLKNEGLDFNMMIAGTGPMQVQLLNQIDKYELNDNVFLPGRIPQQDLADTFAAADCFVLPTRALECFGIIILESYASGVPVIATPVGAIPEVMGDANQAWLCRDHSAEAIAERMREFLTGKLTYDAATLRQHAESFSTQTVLPKLEKIVLGG